MKMAQQSRLAIFALILFLLTALFWFGAQPVMAASQQSGDRVCTGDSLTVASGQTIGNILALGCNVTIQQGATVNGSISDFGGNVDVAGTVSGSIATFGGNVNVAGTVNGSIAAFGGNIVLTETAVVNGHVAAMGGNYISAPGAIVRGNPNSGSVAPGGPVRVNPATGLFSFGFDILGGIVTALAFAALGALVVIFAPNATRRVSDAVQNKPLNSVGIGCLTAIVFPILALLLIITLIGIPVAFLLGILTWLAWIFGGIAVGLLAGEKILGAFKMTNILPVLAVMLGIVLLALIGQIPVLGWFVSCLVGFIGLGAVVMTRFGTRAYPPAPNMALVPAVATSAASAAPETFSPATVDVAAWEAKARQAQASDAPTSALTDATPLTDSKPNQDAPSAPTNSEPNQDASSDTTHSER